MLMGLLLFLGLMSRTLICETVTADRMADLRRGRDRATAADLVELRLDGVTDLDIAGALEGRTKPVIVTLRPDWEGGRYLGSEEQRLRLLSQAVRLGAEYVDLEWRAQWRQVARGDRTQVILSTHDFDRVPDDLADRVRAMRQAGADVVKVAVPAQRLTDCLTLREAVRNTGRVIAIAMGPAGQITRLCPFLYGSEWTYSGQAVSGQVPTETMIHTYRAGHTTSATAIYAVIGAPLAHSASPAMHNAALAAAGIDGVYLPLVTGDPRDFLVLADAVGVKGASVTAPLKVTLRECGIAEDELSERIGAINTVRRTSNGWEGRNFDVAGFLAPLERRGLKLAGQRVVILGAGGAARAAVWALRAHGARVAISARRPAESARLAEELHVSAAGWPPEPGWDLLVNTTPAGTWPHVDDAPIDADHLRGPVVYDLVYNPLETALMRRARAAGAATIGGLEMLVAQACRQFEWWTGVPAPVAAVERGAVEFLGRESVTT
jgi:shikimate dehydrogenase/3-dehydroquinate dehydratase type I